MYDFARFVLLIGSSSEKQSDWINNLWKSSFVVLELVVGSGEQDKIDKMFKEWKEGISGNCSHKKARI